MSVVSPAAGAGALRAKPGSRLRGFCCPHAPGLGPARVHPSALSSPSSLLSPPSRVLPRPFFSPEEATASSRQLALPLASLQTVVSIPLGGDQEGRPGAVGGGRPTSPPGFSAGREYSWRARSAFPESSCSLRGRLRAWGSEPMSASADLPSLCTCACVCVHTHGRAWKHTLTGSHSHPCLAHSHARSRSQSHGHRPMLAHSHAHTHAYSHTHRHAHVHTRTLCSSASPWR